MFIGYITLYRLSTYSSELRINENLYKHTLNFSHFSERSSSFYLGREIYHLVVRFSTIVGVVFREWGILLLLSLPFLFLCLWFFFFLFVVVFLLHVIYTGVSLHPPLPIVLLPWVARLFPLLAVRRLPLIVCHEAAQIYLGS